MRARRRGQWVFDGSSLQAQITVAQGTVPATTISPSSQTFDLPVSEAQGCPTALGR